MQKYFQEEKRMPGARERLLRFLVFASAASMILPLVGLMHLVHREEKEVFLEEVVAALVKSGT